MKKRVRLVFLLLLLCFTLCGQKQDGETKAKPGEGVEADIAAIKALLAEWVDLYNAGNFQKLLSVFYAQNAMLMTPNAPVRRTKEAILLSYEKESGLNGEHVDASVAEDVRVCADLALAWVTDTGTTTPRGGGDPVKFSVKWLMAFERQADGSWKCLYEMWNDNHPPAEIP